MHDKLVILAGGISSRMKASDSGNDLTQEEIAQANGRNKGLISLGDNGRPLLDYLLFNAKNAGYKHIYIVINENNSLFNEIYGDYNQSNHFQGLTISFAIQYIPAGKSKPLGTADALLQASEQFPELKKGYYSVCNSDNLYSSEAFLALRKVNGENAFISYSRDSLEFSLERISRFALAKLDKNNQLRDIIEKPRLDKLDQYKDSSGALRVSMNAFKFNGEMFYNYLKNCPINPERDEKEIPTALLNMLRDYPNSVEGIPFSEHVPDLTSKKDIIGLKEYLKKNYGEMFWEEVKV